MHRFAYAVRIVPGADAGSQRSSPISHRSHPFLILRLSGHGTRGSVMAGDGFAHPLLISWSWFKRGDGKVTPSIVCTRVGWVQPTVRNSMEDGGLHPPTGGQAARCTRTMYRLISALQTRSELCLITPNKPNQAHHIMIIEPTTPILMRSLARAVSRGRTVTGWARSNDVSAEAAFAWAELPEFRGLVEKCRLDHAERHGRQDQPRRSVGPSIDWSSFPRTARTSA